MRITPNRTTNNGEADPALAAIRLFARGGSWWIAAALLLLTFAAHAPALGNGLVWDDTALVLRDPLIRSWRLIPEQFKHFLFTDATASDFYRPVQRLTYTLEYWAATFRPAVYHFSNLLLHAGAALAFFAFASGLLQLFGVPGRRSYALATFAAASWAIHPLHSAVVDYVAGRADSLAALFGFIALFCAIQALREPSNLVYLLGGGFALLASALSKESGLAFALGFVVLFQLRKQWKRLPWAIATVAAVLVIYGTLRAQAGQAEVPQFGKPAPLLVRPIIAARAFAEYAALLVVPQQLHMEHDMETHPSGMNKESVDAASRAELQTVIGAVCLVAALYWIWRARRDPAVFALLLLSVITYAPVSGLLPLNANFAEHWIYVPSAFLLLAIAQQCASSLSPRRLRLLTTLAVLWIACLGIRSFYRAQDWRDQRTFLERTIAAGGNSARMMINLSALELRENHPARARDLARRALAASPGQPLALLNLASLAVKENSFSEAQTLLSRLQTERTISAQAYELQAVLEWKEHAHVDLARLRLATRTPPRSWPIKRRYVRALAESGDTRRALAELAITLRDEPYRAESWQLTAAYLNRSGQPSAAAAALNQAEALDVHLSEHKSL